MELFDLISSPDKSFSHNLGLLRNVQVLKGFLGPAIWHRDETKDSIGERVKLEHGRSQEITNEIELRNL